MKKNIALAEELPKIELHLHLDGSLSPGKPHIESLNSIISIFFSTEFIERQSKAQGVELPVPPSQLRSHLLDQKTVQSVNKLSQDTHNWNVFDFCNGFLQTEDAISESVVDLCERLAKWNVWYAEIRFCPTLHTLKGLSEEQVIEAAIKGHKIAFSV